MYGKRPVDLGEIYLPELFGTYLLYLPVKMKGKNDYRLPLEQINDFNILMMKCVEDYGDVTDKYVYLSYECSYVKKDSHQKRPGWHSDGFKTNDINYIWYSNTPTIFNDTKFKITKDHKISMEQFEEQANPDNNFLMPNKHLLRMDQFVIHKADVSKSNLIRTFVKVSISDDKYNLKGNTHNPYFDYDWKMYDRSIVRNHPQIKETDSVPDNLNLDDK